MPKGERALSIALLLVVVLFAGGLARLFVQRFERGDVYPPYSSLRTDPLGTKVLYDSLYSLPQMEVRRNYRREGLVGVAAGSVMFYLGLRSRSVDSIERKVLEDLETLAAAGGRVIVSFAPEESEPEEAVDPGAEEKGLKQAKGEGKSKPGTRNVKRQLDEDAAWPPRALVAMTERWGFGLGSLALSKDSERRFAVRVSPGTARFLPDTVRWLTGLVFTVLDKAWHPVYLRDGAPVVVERQWGKGTMVLSTDSYFLSNEALLRHRYPGLLAWLLEGGGPVVFDETHFGVNETPGVVALARSYRLHGLFAGLLVLAALYGWKNSAVFLPLRDAGNGSAEGGEGLRVEGKGAAGGFVNLLRRAVDSRDILAVCFQEWKKSLPVTHGRAGEKLHRMEGIVENHRRQAAKRRDPVRDFRCMVHIWTEGKR